MHRRVQQLPQPILRHFHHLKKKKNPVVFVVKTPSSCASSWQQPLTFPSRWVSLFCTICTNEITERMAYSPLVPFAELVFKVHPCWVGTQSFLWLNSTPSYGQTTFCVSAYQLMGIGIFLPSDHYKQSCYKIRHTFLSECRFSFLLNCWVMW